MSLKKRLLESNIEELKWACSTDWNYFKKGMGGERLESLNEDQLADIIIAFYSVNLLENIRFRQLLLRKLPDQRLTELAEKLTLKAFEEPSVNSRNLANLNWNVRSNILPVFRDELGVEAEYLPTQQEKTPLLEMIEPCESLPKIFGYQKEIVDKALDSIQKGEKKFLIQLPTGSGKTRIMMELLTRIKEVELDKGDFSSIFWLAHSAELLEQAISTFKKVWANKGSSPVKIMRLFGGKKISSIDAEGAFVFITLQKLVQQIKSNRAAIEELSDSMSIVVIDEAHKIAAPTYKEALRFITNASTSVIGVSATPGRALGNDKQNADLASIFGNRLLQPSLGSNPIKKLRDLGVLSEIEHFEIESGVNFKVDLSISDISSDFTDKTLKLISESVQRNRLITKVIKKEVEIRNPSIVFSCSVEHSKVLCAFLAAEGIQSAFIDHTKSYRARKNIIEDFRKGKFDVILNYGVLSTGFDAPRIKAVIITRPTSSLVLYSQMIGRGLRGPSVGGNKKCKVIDINDNFENYGDIEKVYSSFSGFWN
jgi:DNA repair protein RadD